MRNATVGFLIILGFIWCLEFIECSQEDFTGNDVHDAEVRLKSKLLKDYIKDVLPPHNSSSPVAVNVGMSVIAIINLDAKTQTLTSVAWLKLIWNDSRLIWNMTDYGGIQVLRIEQHKIWQPDIELYNSANMMEMDWKPEVLQLVYPDGTVAWIPNLFIHSLCDVDLTYYPYDRHNCTYKFSSWTHADDHVDINILNDVKTVALEDAWNTGGEWEIVDTFALKTTMRYQCCNESYPDVTFSVTLQRRSPFYRATILWPLITTAFLILASFWMSPASHHRMTLNVLSILIIFTLLMHLSSKLPAVGNNCPIVMILCAILMMIAASALVISITFVMLVRSKTNEQTPEWAKNIVQSPIMKLMCVATSMYGHVQENGVYDSTNPVAEDDAKVSRSSTLSKPNTLAMLFTLIDRLLFLICFIIITAVMIAACVWLH